MAEDIPEVGVEERLKEDERHYPQGFTLHDSQPEGRKTGPSQEYFPGCTQKSATIIFEKDFGLLEGEKLVAMGNLLNKILDGSALQDRLHSKPQSMGRGQDLIFPLPLSSEISEGSKHPEMARATCRALNLLYGATVERKKESPSAACLKALSFLCQCVDGMGEWSVFSLPLILTFSLGLKEWTIVEKKLKWHSGFLGKQFHQPCLLKWEAFHFS